MRNTDPFYDLIRSIEENLQQGGGLQPPEDGPPRRRPGGGGGVPRSWLLAGLALFLLWLISRSLGIVSDYLWYDSVGYLPVFLTRITSYWLVFLVAALIAGLFVTLNLFIARRLEPFGTAGSPLADVADALGMRLTPILLALGVLFALFAGWTVASQWEPLRLYLVQQPYGATDPIFQRDVSFYLFTLPIWQAAKNWLLMVVVGTLILTAVVSGVGWRGWDVRGPVLLHLAVLAALALLLVAWQYRLDVYGLLYSPSGVVYGPGYSDMNAQLPAYYLLAVITAVAAVVLVVVAILRRGRRAIFIVLGIWALVAVGASAVYPGIVQRFQVAPNELVLERPFIANNIAMTRMAYDLDGIEVVPYEASQEIDAEMLLSEPETVRNIRLWDYRPLLDTYNQIQVLRQYYEFQDMDVDRYTVDGDLQQVMLAARELVPERLVAAAQTWVNQRLVYTHGYGVAASPVAQLTPDGLPEFLLKDLPPVGPLELTEPQIYFGERTNTYVVAGTDMPEFDYPRQDGNATNSFTGDTGIDMTYLNRLFFALRFADINLLLNDDIRPDSQLLWRRNLMERIRDVAPFLRYDRDPYVVVAGDGRLYWMVDGYTVSKRFPYSTPLQPTQALPFESMNYIRNSVKVLTNAYDGTMTFYVIDDKDPLIATYGRLFPELFRPFAEMPDSLKDNVRYPNDLFSIQAEIYRTYHMTDPDEFYNREDIWAWPEEQFGDQIVRMEPYYVLRQLPGDDALSYVQILPFTPVNRENMIAWLAAQSDPADYGRKVVFEFGKDTLFFGPKQVEARIDQDPVISAQVNLWNQQGSRVLRGNLLVIPIRDALIYVEPLYIQSANARFPELKRVIVVTSQRTVMAENLGLALAALFGNDLLADPTIAELAAGVRSIAGAVVTETPIGEPDAAAPAAATDLAGLIQTASDHYDRAQEFLRSGDWAGYGAEMAALETALGQLSTLVGAPTTEPPPAAPQDAAPEAGAPEEGALPAQP